MRSKLSTEKQSGKIISCTAKIYTINAFVCPTLGLRWAKNSFCYFAMQRWQDIHFCRAFISEIFALYLTIYLLTDWRYGNDLWLCEGINKRPK
jgi:hypothetical protein